MNIHIKNFLIGAFGWAVALIFLGIFANACWFLIYLGWRIADYVSK